MRKSLREILMYRSIVQSNPNVWAAEIKRCREVLPEFPNDSGFWHWATHWAWTLDEKADPNIVKDRRRLFFDEEYLRFVDGIVEREQRVLVIKSRQIFMTWLILARWLHSAQFWGGGRFGLQSNNENSSAKLIERIQYMFENQPPFLKQKINPTQLAIRFPEIKSIIEGFPEGAKHVHGQTTSGMLEDECRFNEKLEECVGAVSPSLGSDRKLILLSCACDPSLYFWKLHRDEVEMSEGIPCAMTDVQQPMRGVRTWRNKGNKFFVIEIYYWADPAKDPERDGAEWEKKEKAMTPYRVWQMEYLINPFVFEGDQIYPEWDEKVHVIEPFEIPNDSSCTKIMLLDHGISAPAAALWLAIFEDRVVAYREYYQEEKPSDYHVDRIRELEGWIPRKESERHMGWHLIEASKKTANTERIYLRLIDPATNKRWKVEGTTIFQDYNSSRNAMGFILAKNNWDEGRNLFSKLLLRRNPDGSAYFQVFRNMPHFRREIREYREEKMSTALEARRDPPPSGKPMKKDDHLMDLIRYAVLLPGGLRHIGAYKFPYTKSKDEPWRRRDGMTTGYK